MSDYFDQQGNPAKPEGLHPLGQPDARYPVFYAESVPNGLRVMSEFFAALASHWKHHYPGWTAWLLSPEMKLPGLMRLKESRRVPMWNGPIECRLFRFDLVAGAHAR